MIIYPVFGKTAEGKHRFSDLGRYREDYSANMPGGFHLHFRTYTAIKTHEQPQLLLRVTYINGKNVGAELLDKGDVSRQPHAVETTQKFIDTTAQYLQSANQRLQTLAERCRQQNTTQEQASKLLTSIVNQGDFYLAMTLGLEELPVFDMQRLSVVAPTYRKLGIDLCDLVFVQMA